MYLAEALKKTVGVNEYAPSRMAVQMDVNNLRKRIQKGERATIPKEEPYENRITQYLTEEELKRKINQGAAAYKKGVQDEYDKLKLSVYDNSPEGQELYLQEARKQAEFMKLISDPTKIDQLMKADPAGLKAMLSEAELNRQVLDAKKQQHKLHELARGSTKALQSDKLKEKEEGEEGDIDDEEKEKKLAEKEQIEAEKEHIDNIRKQYQKVKRITIEKQQKEALIQQMTSEGRDAAEIDEQREQLDEIKKELKLQTKYLDDEAKPGEKEAIEGLLSYKQFKDVGFNRDTGKIMIDNRPANINQLRALLKQIGVPYEGYFSSRRLVNLYNERIEELKEIAYNFGDIDPDAKMAEDWARQWASEHPGITEAEALRKGYTVIDLAKQLANEEELKRVEEANKQERREKRRLKRETIEAEKEEEKRKEEEQEEEREQYRESYRQLQEELEERIDRDFKKAPEIVEIQKQKTTKKGEPLPPQPLPAIHYIDEKGQSVYVPIDTLAGDEIMLAPIDSYSLPFNEFAKDMKSAFNLKYKGNDSNKKKRDEILATITPQYLEQNRRKIELQQRELQELGQRDAPRVMPLTTPKRMTEFGHGFKPLHRFPKDVITKSIHTVMEHPSFKNSDQHQYNREQAHHLTQMARLHMTGEGFFGDLKDKIGMWLFKNVHPAGRMLSYIQDKK